MDLLRSALTGLGVLSVIAAVPPAARPAAAPKSAEQPAAPDAQGAAKGATPTLGRYLTLKSPVDDVVFARVRNAALALQNQARMQGRRAVLVLEISPGSSPPHQVFGLAKFLTSADLGDLKTVAWIPQTVTGNNVVVALACNEIVMHPDAELGDIGRGKTLDRDEQQDLLRMIEKRHNARLSTALVLGMTDPQSETLRAKVQSLSDGKETTEYRIVTRDELERLQQTKAAILDVQTIKVAGDVGTYSGSKARSLEILAVQTLTNRGEIAELYNLPREALRDDPALGEKPRVQLIKIDGIIEPVLEAFLERQIERAVSSGANTIIFQIDSPGGYLVQSQNLASIIADTKARTIAYIPREALSGAAIIALGCDEIYMQPSARLGDAGPIEMRTGQQFEHVPEKILSNLKAVLEPLAKKKHRPPALVQAMADRDLQVFQVKNRKTGRVWYMSDAEIHATGDEWEKGLPVPESGGNNLLTVTGGRAHELLLAEPSVENFDDLKQRLGVPPETTIPEAKQTWVDTLVFLLNTELALFLLLLVGGICIYIELHLMTGLLGIIAALCFAILFWSRFLGGTAGWLEILLFLIGAACLAAEIFIIPGFGVFGVTGILLIFVSLILASQTWGNLEPNQDYKQLSVTLGTLGGSIISVVIFALAMSRFLPHVRVFDRLVLTPPGAADAHRFGPKLRPDLADDAAGLLSDQPRPLPGQEGTALTVLRPAGKAKINGRLIDVVSDGPFILQDSRIEVIEVSGNRVVVRQIG